MCFNCGKVKGDVNKFCEQRTKLQTFADWERVESERETASQKLMIRRDTDLSPNNKAEAKSRLVSPALNSSAAAAGGCSGRSNFAAVGEYH